MVKGIANQREEQVWHKDFYPEVQWFANHLIPVEASPRLSLILLLVVARKHTTLSIQELLHVSSSTLIRPDHLALFAPRPTSVALRYAVCTVPLTMPSPEPCTTSCGLHNIIETTNHHAALEVATTKCNKDYRLADQSRSATPCNLSIQHTSDQSLKIGCDLRKHKWVREISSTPQT